MMKKFLAFLAACSFAVTTAYAADQCKNRGTLDEMFCDENKDLVADAPKDPKEWKDPNTLVFTYTPVEDPAVYKDAFADFQKYLEKATGKRVIYYTVQSNAAEVEAMRSGRLHIAGFSTGPTGFAVNLAGYVPIAVKGYPDTFQGYNLIVVTKKDSDINSLADLKGKKVAHTSASSNSGNLAPRAIFPQHGIVPDKDYTVVYSGKHDQSILGVAHGDYDAAPVASDVFYRMADAGRINKDDFKIVFTSLHGTSITVVPEVLKRAGYNNVTIIKEQEKPDGNFPTVKSPNPEEPEALSMAIRKAGEIGADMVIGTDPDSDRLGIAVRNPKGEIELLNGNQTMVMMTKFLLGKRKGKGMKGNEFIASTIVSTPMMNGLAKAYGVDCKIVLTGFKWIAKIIKDFPEQYFVGGGEESFGFMVGDFVRDKDAVTATLLACEIAADAKARGSSFYKELIQCYVDYGFYKEKLVSITKKGISGAGEIKQMMVDYRENPIKEIDGSKVEWIHDYNTSMATNTITGKTETIDVPKSNVLIYTTEDGTRMAARPSGTEPKIKFYFSVNSKLDTVGDFGKVRKELDSKLDRIVSELKLG